MKIAATVSRYLLGLMFTIFGLNGFLHFIPQPPPTSEQALQYLTVLSVSHYFVAVFVVQLVAGILLLSGRFVALAVALLSPILVNILLFHGLMDPGGIAPGVVATILWAILFARHKAAFNGLFQAAA